MAPFAILVPYIFGSSFSIVSDLLITWVFPAVQNLIALGHVKRRFQTFKFIVFVAKLSAFLGSGENERLNTLEK